MAAHYALRYPRKQAISSGSWVTVEVLGTINRKGWRVTHPFGSRLLIPLIGGCPTPVARFWRRGGRNLLEPGGRNKRSPGRECWVSVLNKPESRSRGPR